MINIKYFGKAQAEYENKDVSSEIFTPHCDN